MSVDTPPVRTGDGLALRHYGYKAAFGLDESWIDSGRHRVGAFAAG